MIGSIGNFYDIHHGDPFGVAMTPDAFSWGRRQDNFTTRQNKFELRNPKQV